MKRPPEPPRLPVRSRNRLGQLAFAATTLACLVSRAAEVDVARLPAAATGPVDYERDIKPMLENSCLRCHGPERPKSKFRLDNRESALQGGERGVDIIPGQSARSPLIHFVSGLVADMEMPPTGKGEPLTAGQVGLLRAWIDQGATYPGAASAVTAQTMVVASATVQGVSVSGNQAKFREHWWMTDGVSGGIDRFEMVERLPGGRKFTAEGRIIADTHDYRLKLAYEQDELGFVRGGYEEFRKWSDDTGGYYAPFSVPPPSLGRDLHLDIGRAWFEVGLTKPNLPRATVGYEYQFRDGAKSTTEWGFVSPAGGDPRRATYPAWKSIDEQVHVIRVDLSYDVAGVLLADNFRGEFYDLKTVRENVDNYTLGNPLPDFATRYSETGNHFHAANTFSLEKTLTDWCFVSGGYLYSHLDGEASFNSDSYLPGDPSMTPFVGVVSDEIVLQREAHVFNANAQFKPLPGLNLTAGVQTDWSRQEGFGHATIFGLPSPFDANLERFATDESLSLQYTRIPFTVIHAEARLQQESIGQFERQSIDDASSAPPFFQGDTDAQANLGDYRGGLTISPWRVVALDASYRHREHHTDYQPLADNQPFDGRAYPGFILARALDTDEVSTRLILHPNRWLKTTLSYQWVTTDYHTTTGEWSDPGIPATSGGALKAGAYDAHVYSLGAALTPWRRLYFTGTFSYSDSRTVTGMDTGGSVAPYAGDIYTVTANATFALTQNSDLQAGYAYSQADFRQDNWENGLPLGIDYDRHGLLAGVTRRFPKNLSVSLQYGFFQYREPTAGGASDYTAHAVFAVLSKRLP